MFIGKVIYCDTPLSSRLKIVCSECCHASTKSSGRCNPLGRIEAIEALPSKRGVISSRIIISKDPRRHSFAMSSNESAVRISAEISARSDAVISRISILFPTTTTRFIDVLICQKPRQDPEKCAKNKKYWKKVVRNVVCVLKMTIFAVRNYVKTDITLRLNVRNSRNCRSAIQGWKGS